jgi:hypothetical protein
VRQFSVRRVESAWMVLVPLGLAYFGASALGNLGTAALVSLAINSSVSVKRRSLERSLSAAASPQPSPSYPDGLTQREIEVREITAGHSNQEIADRCRSARRPSRLT